MIARLLIGSAMMVAGCRQPPPLLPAVEIPAPELPAVEPPWPGTLSAVQQAVDSGRFATADSLLDAFTRAYAGTPAADEGAFWRALLRTDPRNPGFSPPNARAALDAYMAAPGAARRSEAEVLLRLLAISDSLRSANAVTRTAAEQRDRQREEELQRLRDELQRTQAELERIKRRLGSKP